MVIRWLAPGVRPIGTCLFASGPSLRLSSKYKGFTGRQFQKSPFKNPNHRGDDSAHAGANPQDNRTLMLRLRRKWNAARRIQPQ
jgi:hypothetical protein